MSAQEDYRWVSISGGETVGVFIHPYSLQEFTGFSINVNLRANEPRGAYQQIAAQMTLGETFDFVDGQAFKIFVKNTTIGPQPYISVGLVSNSIPF